MLTEKENNILDKAEDVILKRLEAALDGGKPLSDAEFEAVLDGIRTLDRVFRMKYLSSPNRIDQ